MAPSAKQSTIQALPIYSILDLSNANGFQNETDPANRTPHEHTRNAP